LLIRKDGEVKYIDKTGDLVVGALEQTIYKMERLTLYPGDSLFMFTDGVTEAMNERGELFSEERLKGEISALRGGSIQEIITGIMAKIREFSEGAAQSDDITMMNLYFRGNGINV
jgi:sigma-B regulation protein RsbU (phosphoserine phosphatase)